MAIYKTGDSDNRPWGSYVVTAVGVTADGEEFCEKHITVTPGQVLSLQSHEHRRETWTVLKGILTVVLDGKRLTLTAGESVFVPLGAIHCMANLGPVPCVVHERQEGVCREQDIRRYVDLYGRGEALSANDNSRAGASVERYQDILDEIRGQQHAAAAE